jgi:DNA-binding GntR family transcriptional regulator
MLDVFSRLFNNRGGMVKSSEYSARQAMAGLPPIQPLPTASQRAADLIRQYIFEGQFAPGTPLPEASLSEALQVSRNTVREAFRTLISEHLLVHEPHKGVTVRWLTEDDVTDIYKIRRMFELSVLDLAAQGQMELTASMRDEISKLVTAAEAAADRGEWAEVGTANLRFHALIVGVHDSERISEAFRHLMTELRLGFRAHEDPSAFHGPFLVRNRRICEQIANGELAEARVELASYLDDAEADVLRAVRQ